VELDGIRGMYGMITDVNKLVSGAATVSQGSRPCAAPFGSSATGGPAFQGERKGG
jgi:hypothetical protein